MGRKRLHSLTRNLMGSAFHCRPLTAALINANPVNLETNWKLCLRRIAALHAADGLVQDKINRPVKWIALVRIVGGGEIKMVHQVAVEQEVNFVRVPVHRPDMKLL